MAERDKADHDQEDVLAKKGKVTRSRIGLQVWGDEPLGPAIGEGGAGTADRAAKIAKLQHEHERGQHEEDREGRSEAEREGR